MPEIQTLNRKLIEACKSKDKELIVKYANELISQGEDPVILRAWYDFTFVRVEFLELV